MHELCPDVTKLAVEAAVFATSTALAMPMWKDITRRMPDVRAQLSLLQAHVPLQV